QPGGERANQSAVAADDSHPHQDIVTYRELLALAARSDNDGRMRTRGLSAGLVAGLAGALGGMGTGTAVARSEPPARIGGGYDNAGYTLNSVPGGCTQDVQTAIDNAGVSVGPTTIEMMPGDYCPFTIGYGIQKLTIVGVGAAGISGGSFTGSEASLTTVKWDS